MTPLNHPEPATDIIRRGATALLAVAVGVGLTACGDDSDDGNDGDALAERQEEVADRGADVMPFDLDATLHQFEPTDDGLIQTVRADDPTDDAQIALVREHLGEEVDAFDQGDFSDPASIHGHDMPGLAELEAGADDIRISYEDLPDGARMTYVTDEPELVTALHSWGEAQVADHGDHAEHLHHD